MSARLVLEIEVPGFNVEEFRCEGDDFINDDEALEAAMGCSENVVLVLLYEGDYGDPLKQLAPLEGRIVSRKAVSA